MLVINTSLHYTFLYDLLSFLYSLHIEHFDLSCQLPFVVHGLNSGN